jgi:hypothetical protein
VLRHFSPPFFVAATARTHAQDVALASQARLRLGVAPPLANPSIGDPAHADQAAAVIRKFRGADGLRNCDKTSMGCTRRRAVRLVSPIVPAVSFRSSPSVRRACTGIDHQRASLSRRWRARNPFLDDVLPDNGHPYRGVSVSVRNWTSDKVGHCPVLSVSVRSVGVHGLFVRDPNQPVPDADPVHGVQIRHGAAERPVCAVLGSCW